jgi:hypothetical protein
MFKGVKYAMNDDKVLMGLTLVSVIYVQSSLQKKLLRKRRLEWKNACIGNGMRHRKLKTPVKTKFANKVIMFEETLEFKQAILLCYGKQKMPKHCNKKVLKPRFGPL